MKRPYQATVRACFTGYIVQAIVNNFAPLLFLTFSSHYQIPIAQITFLVTFNFGLQLLVDLLSAGLIHKIGYRKAAVTAHLFAAAGLALLTILPEITGRPFAGILISVMIYAVGGGLLEVLVSPIVEACPAENKERQMSLLHSFYCWGHVAVVLFSTIFFSLFGIGNWKILCLIWMLIPAVNAIIFTKVPMPELYGEEIPGLSLRELVRNKIFWLMLLLMTCAGACEQAVSQWASVFAEQGLGVEKTVGDLAGPMLFASAMGLSRLLYGKFGGGLKAEKTMLFSGILCVATYLLIALSPVPIFSLIGCGVCGFAVGILWPGAFSTAAKTIPTGGTVMFAFLALAGDLGCTAGPTLVGTVSGFFENSLKPGFLIALIFPALLIITLIGIKRSTEK